MFQFKIQSDLRHMQLRKGELVSQEVYCLDVAFCEDVNCTCKDNSVEDFAVVCCIVLNVLKKFMIAKNVSLAIKRRKCQYGTVFMADVLFSSIL